MNNVLFANKPINGGVWDVIIIGSGPAALTAAIYTTRGAASTLLIAGESWGGQLMLTTIVDNFPGFPQGIQGPELMQKMRLQAERFGAQIIEKNATGVKKDGKYFEVTVDNTTYKAKSIIIATGAQVKWLGIEGEEKLRGRGISSCAPCDAPFFMNKTVAVVGGGDSAMEEALILSKYASDVIIIHRRDKLRASAVMQKRVFENTKIKALWDSEAMVFEGDQVLTSVTIKTKVDSIQAKMLLKENFSSISGKKISQDNHFLVWQLPVDGVFIAIGHVPTSEIFKDLVDVDKKGYIVKNRASRYQSASNLPGIFVAGDVHDYTYKQAITAAGFGCQAAMDVLKFLDES